jgi:hypothetical protein
MAGEKMKLAKTITLSCLGFCVMAVAAVAQPMVVFPTPAGPGIQIPAHTPTNENPIDYGLTGTNFGWGYDSFQAFNSGVGRALIRMAPTLQGPGAFQAMGEADDWVFHMELRQQGAYPAGGDFMAFAKHVPSDIGQPSDGREDRMFALAYGNNPNSWSMLVGNNSGGWTTVASNLSMVNEEYADFDVHYRAADGVMDLYWEGSLAATAATGHGRYDVDFIQVEDVAGGGTTSIRNFRLGHITVVPEPGTTALLAIGAAGLIGSIRRRSK